MHRSHDVERRGGVLGTVALSVALTACCPVAQNVRTGDAVVTEEEAAEAAWVAAVEQSGVVDFVGAGSIAELTRALELLGSQPEEVGGLVDDHWFAEGRRLPPLGRQATAEITEALRRWYREEGGLGDDACLSETRAHLIELITLGRIALLAAASDPQHPNVVAVLALGQALRRQGQLIHALIGVTLFAESVEWANSRGVRVKDAFARYRVRADEVYPAILREWVCAYAFARTQLEQSGELERLTEETDYREAPGVAAVLSEFRRAWGPRLATIGEKSEDIAWIASHANFAEVGGGLLGRIMAIDLTRQVQEFADALEAYADARDHGPPEVMSLDEPEREPTDGDPVGEPSAEPFALEGLERVGDHEVHIPRAELDRLLSNISAWATQARIVPAFREGRPEGFKLFAIREGSLYDQLGFENGDVIRTINGMEVSTPDRALEVYQKIKGATAIEVRVRRGDAELTLIFRIVE